MGKVSKIMCLLLVVLLAPVSLLAIPSTDAQSIPTPSVPKFTVRFVNASYTTTTTNAYTGIEEIEQISNDSIEVIITNQPFDYSNYQLFYNIRTKPHFEGNWKEVSPIQTWTSSYEGVDNFLYDEYINTNSIQQSKSSYTTITFTVRPTDVYQATGFDVIGAGYYGIPYGSQLDFQVEAQVGHPSQRWISDHPLYPAAGGGFTPAVAYDTDSGWSITKTVAIGEPLSTASPSPSPTVPELPWFALLPLCLVALLAALVLKRKSLPTPHH